MIPLTESFVELMQWLVFCSGITVALLILIGLSALIFTKKRDRQHLKKRNIAWVTLCGPPVLLHYYVWFQLPKLDGVYGRFCTAFHASH